MSEPHKCGYCGEYNGCSRPSEERLEEAEAALKDLDCTPFAKEYVTGTEAPIPADDIWSHADYDNAVKSRHNCSEGSTPLMGHIICKDCGKNMRKI